MKHIVFFFISFFFLTLAFFHQPLSVIFPQIFEPVNKFISEVGPSILYLTGFLSLIIAVFTGLPTWISVILFILLILVSGWYLKDKEVSVTVENESLHLSVVKKTPGTLLPPQGE